MLTFRIKVQGHAPYDDIFPNTRAAMDSAFALYPEARSISVRATP